MLKNRSQSFASLASILMVILYLGFAASSFAGPRWIDTFKGSLSKAIETNQTRQVETLLASVSQETLSERDEEGRTALMVALEKDAPLKIIALLLQQTKDIHGADLKGRTPLWYAAKLSHAGLMRILLKKGASIQTRDHEGWTPIALSLTAIECITKSEAERLEALHICLNSGADVNERIPRDQNGIQNRSLLGWAQEQKFNAIIGLLQAHGARLTPEDLNHKLRLAVQMGDLAKTKSLVDQGADPKASLVLETALERQNFEILEFLMTLNTVSLSPETLSQLLSTAIQMGDLSKVKRVIAWGVDVNAPIPWLNAQHSALTGAATLGNPEIVEYLITQGAVIASAQQEIIPSLICAAKAGHREVIRVLQNHIDDPDIEPLLSLITTKPWQSIFLKWIEFYFEIQSATESRRVLEFKNEWASLFQSDLEAGRYFKALLHRKGKQLYYREKELELQKMNVSSTERDEAERGTCISCHEAIPARPEASCSDASDERTGPANCPCLLCEECQAHYCDFVLNRDGNALSLCPSCKQPSLSEFLKRCGKQDEEIDKFRIRQVDALNAQVKGWTFCKTSGCSGGRILGSLESSAYYFCLLCDFEGCLRCGHNHQGSCTKNKEADLAMKELLRLGAMHPSQGGTFWNLFTRGAPPNDPRIGRFRPCYYCGVITEKNGGCNGMECKKCGRHWHWNLGESGPHDEKLDKMRYQPQVDPHF